jgi:hypothetical protein
MLGEYQAVAGRKGGDKSAERKRFVKIVSCRITPLDGDPYAVAPLEMPLGQVAEWSLF